MSIGNSGFYLTGNIERLLCKECKNKNKKTRVCNDKTKKLVLGQEKSARLLE